VLLVVAHSLRELRDGRPDVLLVCCSVLQSVAVCCSVLQCVAVCCWLLHISPWNLREECSNVLLVCCKCVAVRCSVLYTSAKDCMMILRMFYSYVAMCCSVWQCVARLLNFLCDSQHMCSASSPRLEHIHTCTYTHTHTHTCTSNTHTQLDTNVYA